MSPIQMTDYCKAWMDRLESWLALKISANRLFAGAFSVLLLIILLAEFAYLHSTKGLEPKSDYALILGQYLFLFASVTIIYSLFPIMNRFVYCFICFFILIDLSTHSLNSLLLYLAIQIVLGFFVLQLTQFLSRCQSMFLLLFLLLSLLGIWVYAKFNAGYLEGYLPFHVRGLAFLYMPLIYSQVKKAQWIKTFSFPMNWLLIIPIPPHEWDTPTRTTLKTASGWIDLLIGTQSLFFLFMITKYIPFFLGQVTVLRFLDFGLRLYFYFYLISLGLASTFIGCGKILGYNWSKPFHYPFLAHSPAEHWRRWNFQYFQFYSGHVYLPLMRMTGNYFVSIVATFTFSAFTHLELNSYLKTTPYTLCNAIMSLFFFFILHGLAVYSGLAFKKVWGQKNSASGWRGVFLTNFLMVGIHGLRFITL